MQAVDINEVQRVWTDLTEIIFVPHTLEEYEYLVGLLDTLIDEIGEEENHPLASLMEIVGVLVEQYENDNVPELEIEN